MFDRRPFFGLILLILAVSFDHVLNETISCRRSSGLVPYPRTGRSSEMTDFHRSSRTSGLIHYPRVGRSDLPVFYIGANRKNDLGSNIDLEFFPGRGSDIDTTYEPDYEELRSGLATIARHVERNYPKQKQDDSRPYNHALRGSHNRQGQLMMSLPRIGRDISDHDGPMNNLF
ncbi:CAPA peptides-like isoform X1 [Vespa mandarinia]|uniref:CAPA peptides-like isoform X1 n=2 Tax=Vespa mandarinia TaxID=7446 RepID=UPI001611C201|nr:CAPA peptides-like isoform X1 [Vespa mandarinia]